MEKLISILNVGPEEQDPDDGEGKGATSGAGDKATAELEVNYNCSYYRSEIYWCIQDKNRRQVEFLSEELLSFLHSSSGLKGLTFAVVNFTLLSMVSRGKEKVELTEAEVIDCLAEGPTLRGHCIQQISSHFHFIF